MLAIKQIKVDGTEIDLGRKPIDLKGAQDLVKTGTRGSYIEFVRIDYTRPKYELGAQVMVVHEEGLIYGLPVNEKATELYHAGRKGIPDKIVGDVAIVELQEKDLL